MGISRKLAGIHQGLTLPAEQRKALEFLANTENTWRINDLIEGIHEALVAYQVCISNYLTCTMSDIHVRLHYNKISTKGVVNSL